jgi:hypothetical protein
MIISCRIVRHMKPFQVPCVLPVTGVPLCRASGTTGVAQVGEHMSTKDLTLIGVIAVHTAEGLVVPDLYTKTQTANILGTSIRNVERLIRGGLLGSVLSGGRRYVSRDQLEHYVATHYRQPELEPIAIPRGNINEQ